MSIILAISVDTTATFVLLNLLILHIRVALYKDERSSLQLKSHCFRLAHHDISWMLGSSRPTSNRSGKKPNNRRTVQRWQRGARIFPFQQQETGQGLIFVEGGMTVMGVAADCSPHDSNLYFERTVAVSSFFIDSTAVTNIAYGE